jgi:tyrosyl-tRNA synthetase
MAASDDAVAKRLNLITRRIPAEDVYSIELIEAALRAEGRNPRCLWGELIPISSRYHMTFGLTF